MSFDTDGYLKYRSVVPELIRREDLIFELKVRNLETKGTVADLRNSLSNAIREQLSIEAPVYTDYDPDKEWSYIEIEVLNFIEGVTSYDKETKPVSEYRRLKNKFAHLNNRSSSLQRFLKKNPNKELSKELDKSISELMSHMKLLEAVNVKETRPSTPKTIITAPIAEENKLEKEVTTTISNLNPFTATVSQSQNTETIVLPNIQQSLMNPISSFQPQMSVGTQQFSMPLPYNKLQNPVVPLLTQLKTTNGLEVQGLIQFLQIAIKIKGSHL